MNEDTKNKEEEEPLEKDAPEEEISADEDTIELPVEDADKLKKFIEDNTKTEGEEGEDSGEAEYPNIPRETLFDPQNDSMSELDTLPAIDGNVEVTERDKEDYLRAVLNDEPVIMTLELCGGKFNIKIRARTAWEQSLVYEAVFRDQDLKIVNEFHQGVVQLQKYSASVMVLAINGRPFADKTFVRKIDEDWEKDIDELRKMTHEKLDNMDGAKLTLILNALRVFEWKLARISTQCLTGDFWNPAD